MSRPENEMIFAVLEERQSKNGEIFYSGFLGPNTIKASVYNGKLYLRLQKWPKRESGLTVEPQTNASSSDEEVPF